MTSGVGLMTATHLLLKLAVNHANEDDLRRIAECEARLMLAGFGNYQDLRKPGEITKNFVLGIGEKLNNVDGSEGKRIFCDLDEQLRLAGFDNPFDADNVKSILRPYVALCSGATTNRMPDEMPRNTEVPTPRQHASTSRVGILTAVNLLYEIEMGIISDFDLRQLGEYEINLMTVKDVRAEVPSEVQSETRVPVEDNQWPPPTLGTITDSVLTELSTKLTTIQDFAAKDLMLEKTEKLLQQAGFGNHYGAPKIKELVNELEDLRKALGKAFNEEIRQDARELLDANSKESEVSVKTTPDVSSEVAVKTCKIQKKIEKLEKKLRLAGFGEHCSTVQIQKLRKELENLKMTQDKPKDTSEAVEVSPKALSKMTADTSVKAADTKLTGVPLNTFEKMKSEVEPILRPGFVTASYLLCQLEFGDATEDDCRKLAQYEERLKAAGFDSDVKTESAKALGKITNAFIIEYNTKLAETSDTEARNLTSDEYEEHLKQAGFYEHYSAAQFEEIWTWIAKELKKAKDHDSSNLAETLKRVSTELFKKESTVVSAEVSSEYLKETASIEVLTTNGEASKVPAQTSSEESGADAKITQEEMGEVSNVVTDRTGIAGIAAAPCLLFKTKSSQASDDLKKLSELEERLKLSSDRADQTQALRSLPIDAAVGASNQVVNKKSADENSNEVAHDKKVEKTKTDASESVDKNSGQVANKKTVKIENNTIVEKVEEVAGTAGLCVANENAAEIAKEDANEPSERKLLLKSDSLVEPARPCQSRQTEDSRPKDVSDEQTSNACAATLKEVSRNLKIGLSSAVYIVLKVQKGQASEDEIEKLRQCEEKLTVAEIRSGHVQVAASKPLPALGTITFNLLRKFSTEMKFVPAGDQEAIKQKYTTYINKLKLAGFDTISETEEIWKDLENGKAVSNEKVQSDVETSKIMTGDFSNKVPDKDESEVSDKVVNEKKEQLIDNEHRAETVVENPNLVLDKDTESIKKILKKIMLEMVREKAEVAGENTCAVVKDKCPPERKMIVARRRLKEKAPIDWFSTDGSKPPPDFDNSYTRLYSELPLSCRAYAFSTRLKGIKEQLKNINEPLARLLRKESRNVVEAFDRYLRTVQQRASMEPTNSRWTRVQPNQEKWRHAIIFQLFMSLENFPEGLRFRPLDFSQPLTIRASLVAERLKMVEVKLGKADARQALLLSNEFSAIVASFATRWGRPLDCPIPGEPYDDRTSRPLPDELEHLRQDNKRAEREYKLFPSAANKQLRDQVLNEFRRQLAIWKDSQI